MLHLVRWPLSIKTVKAMLISKFKKRKETSFVGARISLKNCQTKVFFSMWKHAQWVRNLQKGGRVGAAEERRKVFYEILSLFKVDIIIFLHVVDILCNKSFIISGFLVELVKKTCTGEKFFRQRKRCLPYRKIAVNKESISCPYKQITLFFRLCNIRSWNFFSQKIQFVSPLTSKQKINYALKITSVSCP